MATDSVVKVCFEATVPEAHLVKWKVKPGSKISQGTVLLLYDEKQSQEENGSTKVLKKMKATLVGTVTQLLKNEGECIKHGCALLYMKGCSHPIVMKDMCAECGADLREIHNMQKLEASVAMVHSIPELVVSTEQAQILGKADEARLLQCRKLVLLVDLDQTVIHTTNDDIPPNLKDVHHFQLHGFHSLWYHARIRPGTQKFLEKINKYFELHICSFGARTYAHTIARILDKDGRYFSHRILSRDECFNPNSKTANLRALFPCGDNLVCIIDDRADVWSFAPNLVQVKPYHFFQHTGDINAPPGLSKTEKDSDEYSWALKKILLKKSCPPKDVCGRSTNQKKETDNGNPDLHDEPADLAEKPESGKKCETVLMNCDQLGISEAPNTTVIGGLSCGETPCTTDNGISSYDDDDSEQPKKPTDSSSDLSQDKKSSSVINANNLTEENLQQQGETDASKEEKNSEKCVVKSAENSNLVHQESLLLSSSESEVNLVEVDDDDDYLLYLSDILLKIHKVYYEMYDRMKPESSNEMPDLKKIIPYVRKKVFEGVRIVFSGVIPTNLPVERSRAYYVANSLGAEIQSRVIPLKKDNKHLATTHVVAARLGTVKVIEAKKCRGIYIVTPDWLWCCADRWEKVDEQLFILNKDTAVDQKPVVPERVMALNMDVAVLEPHQPTLPVGELFPTYDPVTGKRINRPQPVNNFRRGGLEVKALEQQNSSLHDCLQGSDKSEVNVTAPADFATSINPLLSFSSEEIANMDQEVEDLLDSPDTDEEENTEDTTRKLILGKKCKESGDDSSSSGDSLTAEHPRGWKKPSRKRSRRDSDSDGDEDTKRTRFQTLETPDDSYQSNSGEHDSDDFENSVGSVDEEMAAAVEREFLGL